MKHSDESHARREDEELWLEKQSHMHKMYQILFILESSTASSEEKALSEKKARNQFFSSLSDEVGGNVPKMKMLLNL